MSLDIQTLIEKLNPICRKGLESAAEYCVSQSNYNVEVEHLFARLLECSDTDMQCLLRYYEIRAADMIAELSRSVEKFRRGNTRTPALSPHILLLLEQAWLLSSLHFNTGLIRSGTLFLALLDHDSLRGIIFESCPSLKRIPRSSLKNDMAGILQNSGEQPSSPSSALSSSPGAGSTGQKSRTSDTPALDQYTVDLTERGRNGLIDPIQGRDTEIRQMIDILTRRRQNNPILTGEAGVGKTAVAEGFALRIVKGDVPPLLKNISLRLLDLGLLQAGAGVKGEFEKRLKAVIDEVKSSPRPVILFIDEAHTLIGAGGPAGMGDAANLLKPALARGELRTIAATTWSEYKKYFEKDPALARRFQVVKVDEPDEDSAKEMLRGVVENLEKHHDVHIMEEAVQDAVRLSHRYISGRLLPDKAISVLDTACARVSVGQNATPPEIEDLIRSSEQLNLELGILLREQSMGRNHRERISELEAELKQVGGERQISEDRWKKELELAKQIIALQKKLVSPVPPGSLHPGAAVSAPTEELAALRKELALLQQEHPMVPTCVDSGIIASVISDWTGIPAGRMMSDEIGTLLNLKEKMEDRIIGQSDALESICRRIQTYRAELDEPGKPVGVFLLAGPSGVGKTETAIALSEILYGGDRNMITINMSEYQEAYTVSGLKGSPPGYVGYGKGGVLTEAVRQRPYSVVLMDEVEKAHPDVMELFYQVFDKGKLEDSDGLSIDFRNTVILLTSNAGSEIILEACSPRKIPDADTLTEMIRPELLRYFKPALLGRLVIVPYYPLDEEVIQEIVRLKLAKIQTRFRENHRAELTCSEKLVEAVAERCTDADTGARNVDHLLTQTLLPDLSRELLRRMAAGENCRSVYVSIDRHGELSYRFDEKISVAAGAPEIPNPPPRFAAPFDFERASETGPAGEAAGIRPNRKKTEKTGLWSRLFGKEED